MRIIAIMKPESSCFFAVYSTKSLASCSNN